MNIWSEDEITFLIENYPLYGIRKCIENINKTPIQIRYKIAKLKLRVLPNNTYEKVNFTKIVEESINLSDICRKMKKYKSHGNRQTILKYIKLYEINIDHFYIPRGKSNKKWSLDDILVENSDYLGCTTNLKDKLYKSGFKKRNCEKCNQGENWNGAHMSLILDHINGINNDHRLENLRILCPNCNATLETHCRGHKKVSEKYIKNSHTKHCDCGVEIHRSSSACKSCADKNQRVTERPPLVILLKDIKELGFKGTGMKYGVSDNSIRKWIKKEQLI